MHSHANKKNIIFCYLLFVVAAQAQENPAISALQVISNGTLSETCAVNKQGRLISNRAMNIYLSDRVGYYLSHERELSLYKNFVILDGMEKSIAINHHIYTANEQDERIHSLFTVGVRATTRQEFGLRFRYTWLAKGKMYFDRYNIREIGQKQDMDIQRAMILVKLKDAIEKETADFNKQLETIDQNIVMDQDTAAMHKKIYGDFETALIAKYVEKYNILQADIFLKKKPYQMITMHWTDINVYIPLVNEIFYLQSVSGGVLDKKNTWRWEAVVQHTQLIENKKTGRFILQLNAGIGQNNAARAGIVAKTGSMGNRMTYTTTGYDVFLTGSLGVKLVYMPPDWHFGLSGSVQQYIGLYHALDMMTGFPVVLIDKKGTPVVNFEFQYRLFNLNRMLLPDGLNSAINVTVGIPFGSIAH